MKLSVSELKGDARQLLIGRYPTAVGAFLLAHMISYILSALIPAVNLSADPGWLSLLIFAGCSLIIYFLTMLLSVGSNYFYLNIARERRFAVSDIFYSFRRQPDQIILVTLRLLILEILCAVPSLLALFFLPLPFPGRSAQIISIVLLAAAGILSAALLIFVNLKYMLVFYLCIDHPQMPSGELMQLSGTIMQGKKKFLFRLGLSFLGLLLLGLLSFGLGLLWVMPYVNMTIALFYLEAEK